MNETDYLKRLKELIRPCFPQDLDFELQIVGSGGTAGPSDPRSLDVEAKFSQRPPIDVAGLAQKIGGTFDGSNLLDGHFDGRGLNLQILP